MKFRTHQIVVAAVFACLLAAGQAFAIPTCELDCNANTSCSQVCRTLTGGYSTCAAYICDEPQFPWPLTFADTLAEDAKTAEADIETQDAKVSETSDDDSEDPIVVTD